MKLGIPRAIDLLPLRPLGLEAGRALANANPTPDQKRARRAEQLRYIVAQCAHSATVDPDTDDGRVEPSAG
ncbi:MAG: hypothetical protein QOG80_2759 [Pseudonocardiales bacterium]|jgi:hypothetical protein|nr:hypothetical protein [Pseudonocardiales bacterium]